MITVSREHVISAAHRLYDYNGKCERLHGHNYRIVVTLTARRLNRLGMVADFADIKRALFTALDEAWDHHTLLFSKDPLCAKLAAICGDDSVRPVPFNPTAENMARHLGEKLFPRAMQEAGMTGIGVTGVSVYETGGSAAHWSGD